MEEISTKQRFFYALFIPSLLVLTMFFVFVLCSVFDTDITPWGVYPRRMKGLVGVFTHVFIHADWKHLINNLFSFWILSVALFYFYHNIALKVLTFMWLSVGICIWCFARSSSHIGVSGVIYALAFFLFLSGFLRRHAPLMAISFIVIFLYGSMVWYLFPWKETEKISWEGHLFGALCGVILALIYRQQGPQKPVKIWTDDLDESDPYWEDTDDQEKVL